MQRKDAITQKIFRVEENHQNRRGSKRSFKVLGIVFHLCLTTVLYIGNNVALMN